VPNLYHAGVPADLYRELLGDPAAPCLLLTHGIYGSGANWRGIARKVIDRRPDWSIALVDLRNHGRSGSGEPPHTLAACADDIAALVAATPTVRALAGHSFGGKVMLAARARVPSSIEQTWMFDSSPSPRPGAEAEVGNSVTRVLEHMEQLPRQWPSRDAFIAALVAAGEAKPLAQWLGMNVAPDETGDYVLRLDLAAIREMLRDYYAQDLWPVALDAALPGTLEVVIAEKSDTLDAAARTRLASAPPHVHVHRIDSGHWLHIEAPANVVELLVSRLPTSLRAAT
jgi:pimeloyl-ACP methyl ester carboxylesterase